MPSKIVRMMASRKPSIIKGNQNSEAFQVVKESRMGYFINESSSDRIIDCIVKLSQNHELSREKGSSAREYVLKNFRKEEGLEKFVTNLKSF